MFEQFRQETLFTMSREKENGQVPESEIALTMKTSAFFSVY
jgi:hypothetical protein